MSKTRDTPAFSKKRKAIAGKKIKNGHTHVTPSRLEWMERVLLYPEYPLKDLNRTDIRAAVHREKNHSAGWFEIGREVWPNLEPEAQKSAARRALKAVDNYFTWRATFERMVKKERDDPYNVASEETIRIRIASRLFACSPKDLSRAIHAATPVARGHVA